MANSIISLIPARMGSTRLPGKSGFKFMLGYKPMIQYTIDAVQEAGVMPNVFTDENIINHGGSYKLIKRPPELAGPQVTMNETVARFIEFVGAEQDDIILLTYPTCPFRTAVDIEGALTKFSALNAKSLQSLNAVDYRPYGLMKQKEYAPNYYSCLQKQNGCYQAQNTPPLYKSNGAIYIFRVSELPKLNKQMFNEDTIGYVLSNIHAIDIDTELDYIYAKAILESGKWRDSENSVNQLPDTGKREPECNPDWDCTGYVNYKTSWV